MQTRTLLVAAFVMVFHGLPAHAWQWADATSKHTDAKSAARGHDGLHADQHDRDSDGDGLPDFQEVHKYRTDPKSTDTAGEGVADAEWQQRREFTYSVRTIIRVMPPYNLKAMNDDYQDVRVLSENKQYAELEVVVYPLNSNASAITGNRNWRKDYVGMREYLAPGITTNWDEAMRKSLLGELAENGIDPDKLTDKKVVERVSHWLLNRTKDIDKMFCTYYVDFSDRKPSVLPGLEEAFERGKGNPRWTVQQEFEHELLGKEMFANKTTGSCTSFAILETTVLRALGIPTRMIICIPLADGSDPKQIAMVDKGLTHHQVHRDAYLGVSAGADSFSAHTFCEVFVGRRWRRLNYTALGQNVLSPNYLGLMIKVHTFNDLSEANLAATWGRRYGKGLRNGEFKFSNPYRLVKVSDHFGKYAHVSNPPVTFDHKQITIDKAYWPESKSAPQMVREIRSAAQLGGRCFWIHCHEWLEGAGGYLQYQRFMSRADKRFILRARGRPDVHCCLSLSDVAGGTEELRELEVVIPPVEYAKMAEHTAYSLHPVNVTKDYVWKVRDGLTLTRTNFDSPGNTPVTRKDSSSRGTIWFSAGPAWEELERVAKSRGCGLGSFNHNASHYETILSRSQPGSMLVLLLALDHPDGNIPQQYQDLLPVPLEQITASLNKGETVERAGKARERNVLLLAAPTKLRLEELIRKTKLLPPGPPNQ